MAGFFIYVSNTTSKEDGYLCFQDMQTLNGTLSENQKINCTVYGRYVIYYNERRPDAVYPSYYSDYAFSELCEVEVYGECKLMSLNRAKVIETFFLNPLGFELSNQIIIKFTVMIFFHKLFLTLKYENILILA